MKTKIVLISALALLSAAIFSLAPTEKNGDFYRTKWAEIEKFEKKQLTESALAEVEKVRQKAENERNNAEIVRALIYECRLRSAKFPDAERTSIAEMEKIVADGRDETLNAILHSLLADLYINYYTKNFRVIDRRTNIDAEPADLDEWPANLFVAKFTSHLKSSLEMSESTKNQPAEDFSAMLDAGSDSRTLRPTLYDLLAYRALDLVERHRWQLGDDSGETDWLSALAKATDFAEKTLPDTDSPDVFSLKIYQNLLKFHQKKEDAALLHCDLQRLHFSFQKNRTNEAETLYATRLGELAKQFENVDFSCEATADLARYFYEKTSETADEQQQNAETANRLCADAIRRFPNYKRINILKNLQKEINAQQLSAETDEILHSGDEAAFRLSWRNVNEATLRIYKVDTDAKTYSQNVNFYKNTISENAKLILTKKITFPDKNKFVRQDSILRVNAPDFGIYEYSISVENARRENLSVGHFYVSNLLILSRKTQNETEVFVLDRKTGEPQKNASVKFYAHSTDKKTLNLVQKTIGSDSLACHKFRGENQRILIGAENGRDAFFPLQTTYNYAWRDGEKDTSAVEQTAIFTDREIYRPGQKIHFKAVVYKYDFQSSAVVSGKKTSVELLDANGKKIAEKELTTNDFGSISGDFSLPENLLSGRFGLRCNGNAKYFSVEEYKRPKIELNVLPIEGAYTFGDTIQLRGTVKTFSGAPCSFANVAYVVEENDFAWYGKRPNSRPKSAKGDNVFCDKNGYFNIKIILPKAKNRYATHLSVRLTATDEKGESQETLTFVNVNEQIFDIQTDIENLMQKENLRDINVSVKNANGTNSPAEIFYKIEKIKAKKSLEDIDYQVEKEITHDNVKNSKISSEILQKLASGRYKLTISATDEKARTSISEYEFLLYSVHDAKIPDKDFDFFVPLKTTCADGENAQFLLGTAAENVHVLVEISDDKKILERRWTKLNDEMRRIEIPYKKSFGDQIRIQFSFVKNGQIFTNESLVSRQKKRTEMRVEFSAFRDKLLPGENEIWKLRIFNTDKNSSETEFACTLYDASLDKFVQNVWNFPSSPRKFRAPLSLGWNAQWPRRSAAHNAFPIRYAATNNLVFDAIIPFYSHRKEFGIYPTAATMAGNGTSRNLYMQKSVYKEVAEDSAVEMEAENSENESIHIRENFAETAFFFPNLQPDQNGEISVPFTILESLTRWKFIGVAHTKDVVTAAIDTISVTQKPFSLSANMPRFALQGDILNIRTTLSNLADRPIEGTCFMEISDSLSGKILQKTQQPFRTETNENQSLSWKTTIAENQRSLIFKFYAKSENFSDGEQYALPVFSNKENILETFPFSVTEKGESRFFFADFAEKQNENLRNIRFTIEYTNNPVATAIQTIPYISKPKYENAISYFSAFYVNLLGAELMKNPTISAQFAPDSLLNFTKNKELKISTLEQTTWENDAQQEAEQHAALRNFFDKNRLQRDIDENFEKLKKLQLQNGAFSWFDGMGENRYSTQFIAENLCRLQKKSGITLSDETEKMRKNALEYLTRCTNEDFKHIVKYNKKHLQEKYLTKFHIQHLYTKSFSAEPLDNAEKYFLQQMEKFWTTMTLYEKALSATTLQRYGKKKTANDIIRSLRENYIVGKNREIHWPQNTVNQGFENSPISTQTALIEAFSEISPDKNELNGMVIWLLQQKQTQCWRTEIATTNAISAILNNYPMTVSPNDFQLFVGGKEIPHESENALGYVKKTFDSVKISKNLAEISVKKSDDGFSYGCAYWQYSAPTAEVENSQSDMLNINKKLFIERATQKGVLLEEISPKNQPKIGDRVVVRLTVNVKRNMDFVCLRDNFSAGFEPTQTLSGYHYNGGTGFYQTYGDRSTQYFFDTLRRGTYIFEYTLYAARSGQFTNGTGAVQCLYAPDFSNHTEGNKIIIEN